MMNNSGDLADRIYVPAEDVLHQRVGAEVILINLKNDRIYSLNPTGARFFELLESKISLSEIKDKLCEEFDVSPEALEQELQDITKKLLDENLINVENI
jgi:hypothetical protein